MAENTREQRRRKREYEARQVVHDVQLDRRRSDNTRGLIALAAVAVLAVGAMFAMNQAGLLSPDSKPEASTGSAPVVPDPAIAENREWTGTMNINDVQLEITIDGKAAPQAAANFIDLANKDFYQDVTCHRITTGEAFKVLQCGDPKGDGSGGPGYQFGPVENAPVDGMYKEGVIAMARTLDPNSMGSQFFIVYGDTELLDPTGYTVFGHVTGGLDDLKSQVTDPGVSPNSPNPSDGPPAIEIKLGEIALQ